jgi:hypothetical protein
MNGRRFRFLMPYICLSGCWRKVTRLKKKLRIFLLFVVNCFGWEYRSVTMGGITAAGKHQLLKAKSYTKMNY